MNRKHADLKHIIWIMTLCLLLAALPASAQEGTAEATSDPVSTWTPAPDSEETVDATNTSEPVATWTPDTAAEETEVSTAEATVEAAAEATNEATVEPTEEATAEITAAVESAETSAPENPEAAPPGLTSGVLLVGVLAVLTVGGVMLMRERGGRSN